MKKTIKTIAASVLIGLISTNVSAQVIGYRQDCPFPFILQHKKQP
ncbi:hypothetical protein [Aquimarina sp. U1-2]|nr:hypothetical protein [Aquimarina sp. U1-2]